MFGRKKKAVIVPTIENELDKVIKAEDKKVDNYTRAKPAVKKLIARYKKSLIPTANLYDHVIRLTLKKEFYNDFPDGFFAYADKLGLNIEPICNTYNSSQERDFTIRAKKK